MEKQRHGYVWNSKGVEDSRIAKAKPRFERNGKGKAASRGEKNGKGNAWQFKSRKRQRKNAKAWQGCALTGDGNATNAAAWQRMALLGQGKATRRWPTLRKGKAERR